MNTIEEQLQQNLDIPCNEVQNFFEYNKSLTGHKFKLHMLHLNIRSYAKKFDSFLQLLTVLIRFSISLF